MVTEKLKFCLVSAKSDLSDDMSDICAISCSPNMNHKFFSVEHKVWEPKLVIKERKERKGEDKDSKI